MTAPTMQTAKLSLDVQELLPATPFGTLETEHVQVWWIRQERFASRLTEFHSWLAKDEAQRAVRFRFTEHRNQYVLSRGMLRLILGHYLQTPPSALRFTYSEKDKPELLPTAGSRQLRFNVSHSGAITVYAFVWNRRVGVDVEFLKHDVEAEDIAKRFFSLPEQEELRLLPAEERFRSFFLCWTRKEAYVKATGDGLSLPLDQFDVSLVPGKEAKILATRPDSAEAGRWRIWDLNLDAQYASALVVEE